MPNGPGLKRMINPPCEVLEWDSEFFGFRIARLRGTPSSKEEMAHVLDWCVAEGIRCLYYLAPSDNAEVVRIAEEHQFAFVDIRLTLERRGGMPTASSPTVRLATREDVASLAAIAKSAHTDSRFYYDQEFPRGRCGELYELWIEKSCEGFAGCVLVAEHDGKVAGYTTCNHEGETGRIGLIAVADWIRGAGLGRQLVGSSLEFFQRRGAKRIQVVTQGRNIPAQRLYQRCGFLTRSLELWYHRWFR